MAKKDTEVTKAESTELAKFEYGDDSGKGYENQTSDDVAIPFITVLQASSPQVVENKDGCRPGKLFNTLTEETYDEFLFVPVTTQHAYVEWKPRDAGGGGGAGFAGSHPVTSELVKETLAKAQNLFQAHRLDNGNDLVETFYMYGVIVTDEGDVIGPAVLSFSSTFIKRYKGINTRLQSFQLRQPDGRKVRPPMFAHVLKVKTFLDQNPQFKWHNFMIEPAKGDILNSLIGPDDPRYAAGREMRELIESGKAKADFNSQKKGEGAEDDGVPTGKDGKPIF